LLAHLLLATGDMATEVRICCQFTEAHVGTTDGGTSDDGEKRIDLGGGLHAAQGLSEEFGQHVESVC